MSSVGRASAPGIRSRFACGLGVATLITVGAGCSADVTRFDLLGGATPSVPGYDNPQPTSRRAGVSSGLQESTLAPVRQPPSQDYRVVGRNYPTASAPQPPQGRSTWLAKAPDRAPSTWGNHSTPAWRDLQPVVRGARAPLPQAWRNDPPPWTDAEPFPWPGGPAAQQQTVSSHARPPTSSFQGHYTVKRRDTLARIAGHYRVNLDELKRVNGIAADATRVKTGTVLAIPVRSAALSAAAPPRVVQAPARAPSAPPQPTRRESAPEPAQQPAAHQDGARETPTGSLGAAAPPSRSTAHATEVDVAAAEIPAAAGGKFRWPARGKIISGFGRQPDGSKSEGINLSLPMGTDIHAAEAGRVHYVGDGLKGYGNLILIRHANGWVSAYAHADKMLVKVGDEVKRGQVIGKVGRSGPVTQPQLRFELRKGSVPVDPLPYLAK